MALLSICMPPIDPSQQSCAKALAAFNKTKELLPGEQQTVVLTFPLERLASYDESRSAWLLECGDYLLSGNSSRNLEAVAVITIPETVITEQCKNLFRNEKVEELTKRHCACARQSGDVVRLTADVSSITTIAHTYSSSAPLLSCTERVNLTLEEVRAGKATAEELVAYQWNPYRK